MDAFNTYEYVVSQKSEGKYRWRRVGLFLLYILYVITFFSVGVMAKLLVPFIALIPVTTWILVYFTWRYVSIDYEYSITSGVITFTKIYGNRTRKVIMSVKIKDASTIAPFSDRIQESKFEAYGAEHVYIALSSLYAEDAYFLLYANQKGERCALAFEATTQALKLCRFYNSTATVIKPVKY